MSKKDIFIKHKHRINFKKNAFKKMVTEMIYIAIHWWLFDGMKQFCHHILCVESM